PSPSTSKDIFELGSKQYHSVIQTDFLIITEIEKGIARGYFIDVFPMYFSFISRHLCVMLNLKYRPERADFGLRYGRLDYSSLDTDLIDKSLKVSTIEEMKMQFEMIKSRYYKLKEELSANYLSK